MPSSFDYLPVVTTRKEFMDYLGGVMSAQVAEEEEEEEIERRGRPRELKSYLFESNTKPPSEFNCGEVAASIRNTGVDNIKIVNMQSTRADSFASFFLDISDERFWVLHTGALAEDAHVLVRQLASGPEYQFDRAWIPTQVLEGLSALPGNAFNGFGLQYVDLFTPSETPDIPLEELTMTVSGSSASKALKAVRAEEELQRSISYSKVRIRRGTAANYSKDDLRYDGAFSVKSGSSIDDHMSLVDETKTRYRELVGSIERFRLGTRETDGISRIRGKAFNLVFERKIQDFRFFLGRLLDSKEPFRLWGLGSKASEDYYQVLALDMHSGSSIDLEISPEFIRAYLPEGACGNTLLRLYVNLQHFFDSRVRCEELVFQ
ncbi:MAG: hypothetical protein WCC94_08575 [Candidatus Bathyarchaeia archaeon]